MNASDKQRFDKTVPEVHALMMALAEATSINRAVVAEANSPDRPRLFAEGTIAGAGLEVAKAAWYTLFPGVHPPYALDVAQIDRLRGWFDQRIEQCAIRDGLLSATMVNVLLDTVALLMQSARSLQDESRQVAVAS